MTVATTAITIAITTTVTVLPMMIIHAFWFIVNWAVLLVRLRYLRGKTFPVIWKRRKDLHFRESASPKTRSLHDRLLLSHVIVLDDDEWVLSLFIKFIPMCIADRLIERRKHLAPPSIANAKRWVPIWNHKNQRNYDYDLISWHELETRHVPRVRGTETSSWKPFPFLGPNVSIFLQFIFSNKSALSAFLFTLTNEDKLGNITTTTEKKTSHPKKSDHLLMYDWFVCSAIHSNTAGKWSWSD